ncbi:MAG: bifunctional (p)ppGpp synthetase/guanosine-3',5'-bis(diphosphate) 3'-pyrophosphohydrolase [Desulfobulbaceae bacterium]|nr:bifunctional (p)ppGpp synthetase/guanosine-3',5'-bis(diphosphate) 3'-pyrophosphohydrolase [Desulfobulbaceae bacterium]
MEVVLGGQDGETHLFWQAFSFAVDAHQHQRRKSGEAYVSHPCEVSRILVEEFGVRDPETLAAAVLHDTVEDVKEVTLEVIGEMFGKGVEDIVDGLTKMADFEGDQQAYVKQVHRKIFLGSASRLEVMLIKLADRLHNLRTMASMPRHKQQKIAEETLDVYAPMAGVIGLYKLKRELYDLALQYKFPRQAHKLANHINQLENSEEVHKILSHLQEELAKVWITAQVELRVKGLWAYFDPIQKQLNREIETPLEILIMVDDIQTCYRVLGITNQTYPPIPRTIRDFIANPKPTGYQCIHTRNNIRGQKYLFKIRTREMLENGRSGILKEWKSQGKVPSAFAKAIKEMFDIIGTDENISYREIIAASGKKEIYTYSPKGDAFYLPQNSIVLDFAFKVHTEVGRRCAYAMVGTRKLHPGNRLRDGDPVQIVTQPEPVIFEPSILELCQTPRARSELGKMFRARRLKVARKIGRSIIEQELKRYGIPVDLLDKEDMELVCEELRFVSVEEFFQHIGEGGLPLKEAVAAIRDRLFGGRALLQPPTGTLNRIYLETLDPAVIKFSRCCHPTPVDKGLIGLLSERGISVHKKECERVAELGVQREDVVELRWKLKETRVEKQQTLLFLKAPSRNRLLMLLGVAPEEMKTTEIILLASGQAAKTSAWEVKFQVETLQGLKNILVHFHKSAMEIEFDLEH